jgi:hypothetical protein
MSIAPKQLAIATASTSQRDSIPTSARLMRKEIKTIINQSIKNQIYNEFGGDVSRASAASLNVDDSDDDLGREDFDSGSLYLFFVRERRENSNLRTQSLTNV